MVALGSNLTDRVLDYGEEKSEMRPEVKLHFRRWYYLELILSCDASIDLDSATFPPFGCLIAMSPYFNSFLGRG